MSSATCVQRETLKLYLIGGIDDQLSAEIESHLSQCKDCEQTVVELESHPETLIVSVRNLAGAHDLVTEADENPSVVERAVEAARRLPGTSLPSPTTLLPHQQIGAYELLRPLGRGGMGMVVLARHRSLHKEVAIKLLSSFVGDKPELVYRFQREMRAAGRLQHPAIVNATDAGQEHGTHYLVMEFISGLDLSRIARLTGPLGISDASELMRQTALGLSYAHAEGIVHRDVKPSNLMLDATGHVKILDFGLAQMNLWEEPVCELTTVGQLMGTIDYMAPEQAERTGAVDYRADLYSLGATLFRLLAGRAPLAAAPNMTLLEKVRLLGSQTSPLLSSLREDCPPALVELVSQLLARDPAARPASAAHVAEALQPFCEGSQLAELLVQAQSAAATESVVEPVAASEAHPPKLQFADFKGVGKPPRRRWAWTTAAAAAVPLMMLAGVMITIETNQGQLVIQSEVADVHVKVARDGKVVDELTIHPGAQSTRLRADKYEILIDAASDQIAIDRQKFSIKSGETVVATIRRVEHFVEQPAASDRENQQATSENALRFAQKIVERYDKNRDGVLSPLEWTAMTSNPYAADVDNDGYVTFVEYAKWMEPRSVSASSATPAMSPSTKTESVVKSIPSEPFYDGRTLPQWLEILERDRDTEARMTALKAIGELTSKTEAGPTTERLKTIARQANVDEWSDMALAVNAVKFGGFQTKSTLDSSLISLLISLNGMEWFQSFFTNDLLNGDDAWSARWLAVLLKNSTSWREADVGATIFERYRDPTAFNALGANSVWLVEAWMIKHLSSNETIAKANTQHVIELVENHPQLGKMVALQIDAEIGSRFNGGSTHRLDRASMIIEEAVAKYSKTVFEDDGSNAEAVARAASRLASTSKIVDDWRTELLETIRKRLADLAADQERLTTMLPIEAESNRFWTQLPTFDILPIPFANRFAVDPPGTPQSSASSHYLSRLRARGVPPYIESECIAIIALVIRLNAAIELDNELAVISEAAFPDFKTLMIQSGDETMNRTASYWPYRLDKAGDTLSSISSATWLGWGINRTLHELFDKGDKRLPLLSLKLLRLNLLSSFVQRDRNHDGTLSQDEFPFPGRSSDDSDKDGNLDYDRYEKMFETVSGQTIDATPASKMNSR